MVKATDIYPSLFDTVEREVARATELSAQARLASGHSTLFAGGPLTAAMDAERRVRAALAEEADIAARLRGFALEPSAFDRARDEAASLARPLDPTLRWQSAIEQAGLAAVIRSYDRPIDFSANIETLARSAQTAAHSSLFASILDPDRLGLSASAQAMVEATSLKMSVLAGIGATEGIDAPAFGGAWQGLLGAWHSHPDLPPSFDEDSAERWRHYARAEVDPGLIAVEPPALVEVVVASGLVAGARDDEGSVATIRFGGVAMAIRSTDSRSDARRALTAFEERMRVYVEDRFTRKLGPDWFKHRVDIEMVGKMRKARASALKAGEAELPRLSYLDLGDLKTIVKRRDNWREHHDAAPVRPDGR